VTDFRGLEGGGDPGESAADDENTVVRHSLSSLCSVPGRRISPPWADGLCLPRRGIPLARMGQGL